MNTIKRNEAVAYLPHYMAEPVMACVSKGEDATFPAYTARHDPGDVPLYSQEQMDALQGEVSRLRAKVESARALAQHWQGMAAESWAEHVAAAALQSCCDELLETLNLEPPTDGR